MGRAYNGMLWAWDLSRTLGWQSRCPAPAAAATGASGGSDGGCGGGKGSDIAGWALPGEGDGAWLAPDGWAGEVNLFVLPLSDFSPLASCPHLFVWDSVKQEPIPVDATPARPFSTIVTGE